MTSCPPRAATSLRRRQRGVSVFESLVAFVVLALGTAAVAELQSQLRLAGDVARERSEAVRLGQEASEDMRAFAALEGAPGQRTYAAIASGDASIGAASSPAAHTEYRIERRIDPLGFGATKATRVAVRWRDRAGSAREVVLHSFIAGIAPAYAGSLALDVGTVSAAPRGAFGPHHHPPARPTPIPPCSRSGRTRPSTARSRPRACASRRCLGQDMLVVEPSALKALAEAAFTDINHLLRPAHLKQLRAILDDPEATANDKFVAYDLLKNANIAAGGVLPMCQDTGTAIIMGKKGRRVWTDGSDEGALAEGARDAYLKKNLRYSQLAPLSMFEETNTRNNMPAQVEIYAEGEDAYKFLFVAKGGGSANKTFLFQATPSILTHDRMIAFLKEKILTLGTAACPPYHLAIVIGGTSAELNLKTVKLASTHYLDELPTEGGEDGHAFRDLAMERRCTS